MANEHPDCASHAARLPLPRRRIIETSAKNLRYGGRFARPRAPRIAPGRAASLLVRAAAMAALIAMPLMEIAGCGSSPSQPAGQGGGSSQPGAFFSAVPPTISPNTVWHVGVGGAARRGAGAVASAQSTPGFDRYFYIVNGILSDGSAMPTGPGTSSLSSTPLVLTVNGSAPVGATAPNGGTFVGVEPYAPSANGSQLWKAVAAPVAGDFYLRSAESFAVSRVSSEAPSMLVGFSTQVLPLDLGFVGNWGSAIFINQQNSPAGDISSFQQWNYDTSTAQLTNLDAGGQLFNAGTDSQVAVGAQAPAAANQWYTYPSYFVGQVVNEPDSNPPFPAPATAGQAAAYDFISNLPGINVGGVTCNYEGTSYSGIRCEYEVLTTPPALTNCFSAIAAANASPPTSYNGTPISPAEWNAVASQVANECTYAVGVQNTFDYYNQIFDYVFINAGDQIASLAADVGVSTGTGMTVSAPIELLDGILYTLLNATKDTGAGVLANLMETAVNTALAVPGNTLDQKLATTVGELYGALSTTFQQVSNGATAAENSILQDWGRLQQIGPATNVVGYNGLGLTTNGVTALEQQALSAYELAIMEQLMPLAYDLYNSFANKGAITGLNTSNYNNYSYATFGSASLNNYNAGSFVKTPSLKVMQTDIFGNGANPFEVFNALNGWQTIEVKINGNNSEYCKVAAITLFNSTANDLLVTITPSKGTIASPGCSGVTCTTAWRGVELRPYGYLTLYAAASGFNEPLEDKVEIFSGSTLVGTLSLGGNSYCSNGASLSGTTTSSAGFSFSPVETSPPRHSADGGIWTTIYQ